MPRPNRKHLETFTSRRQPRPPWAEIIYHYWHHMIRGPANGHVCGTRCITFVRRDNSATTSGNLWKFPPSRLMFGRATPLSATGAASGRGCHGCSGTRRYLAAFQPLQKFVACGPIVGGAARRFCSLPAGHGRRGRQFDRSRRAGRLLLPGGLFGRLRGYRRLLLQCDHDNELWQRYTHLRPPENQHRLPIGDSRSSPSS